MRQELLVHPGHESLGRSTGRMPDRRARQGPPTVSLLALGKDPSETGHTAVPGRFADTRASNKTPADRCIPAPVFILSSWGCPTKLSVQ